MKTGPIINWGYLVQHYIHIFIDGEFRCVMMHTRSRALKDEPGKNTVNLTELQIYLRPPIPRLIQSV